MYRHIFNPVNNRILKINSKNGINILKKHIRYYLKAGAAETKNDNLNKKDLIEKIKKKIIQEDPYLEEDDVLSNEEIDKIKKDYETLINILNKQKNGGIIILGDPSHGANSLLYLNYFYKLGVLPKKSKKILENSVIFTEINGKDYQDFSQLIFDMDIITGFQDLSQNDKLIAMEHRCYTANDKWSKIILKNINKDKVNIICVGRAHIYCFKEKLNEEEINAKSLQEILKEKNNIEYFSITGSCEDKDKINMDNSGYTNMGGKLCEEYLDGNKIREEMLVNNLYFFLN